MRTRAILLCAALLCDSFFGASLHPGSNPATTEGLLLGFSSDRLGGEDHDSAQEFSTAWIVRHGKTAQLVVILPYLIVPRSVGFWRVGIKNVCEMYGEHDEFRSRRDIVWSGTVDATPQLHKGPDCPSKQQDEPQSGVASNDQQDNAAAGVDQYTDCLYRSRSISFVSPDYISETAKEGNTEACEARGFRWSAWSRVLSITTPEMKEVYGYEEKGPIAKTLTDFDEQSQRQAVAVFDAAYTDGLKNLKAEGFDCERGDTDYLGWEIKRKHGMWTPWISQQVFLGMGGCEIAAYVPRRLPTSLVGRNQLVPSLAELKKAVPDLTDAFTSPAGDTTVVLTNAKVLVFSVSRGGLGAKLLEINFPSGVTSVMEQWALGTHVEKWTQQVQQWKIHPLSGPVISAEVEQTK